MNDLIILGFWICALIALVGLWGMFFHDRKDRGADRGVQRVWTRDFK